MSLIFFVTGCKTISKNSDSDKNPETSDMYSAEKDKTLPIVDEYFSLLKEGKYEEVISSYDDGWFVSMNRTQTEDFLKGLEEKLGAVKDYSVDTWESKKYYETNGGKSGYYVILTYVIHREKFDSREVITLFRAEDDDTYNIFSHNVYSEGYDQ